jgi:predicted RNase H-like HicB family nuclease
MTATYILSDYIGAAMEQATYERLDDGSYVGRIPPCPGVIAFGTTLRETERELQSTLEDWVWIGLKLSHALPVLGELDLNREPRRESVDAP